MSAIRKRCVLQNCGNWEFMQGYCRPCSVTLQQLVNTIPTYATLPPLHSNLIVSQVINNPHYLQLSPGERVDVLDLLSDHVSVVVRSAAGNIGYWSIDCLTSDDEIAASQQQYAAQQRMEAERRMVEERGRAEREYEEHLRQKMLTKAEEDRRRQAAEAARRKKEEEERLRLEEERRRWEEAERQRQQAEKQEMMRLKAEERARDEAARVAEARRAKEVADEQARQRQDDKLFAGMPQWKRDLIIKKRQQDG